MRARRVVLTSFIVGIAGCAVFGVYLGYLYGQLKEAFYRQEQFIPTRIYSDVSRIAPPQNRGAVEARLKSLAYHFEATSGSDDQIRFTLHPADYPLYLVPDSFQSVVEPGRPAPEITLHFSGTNADAALQSIEIGGKETPELYLEPEIVTVLARSGAPNEKKQIRAIVKFADIPAPVWQAIIAIEDQHFMEHAGLDPRGIARAVLVNLRTLRFAQGGSTLTMQLVKNLMERRNKNVFRKANELFLALLLESTFDKEQILERYLNEVYLGQVGSYEVHGVAEGARHFFGKDLSELNLAETALMAGLIRGPGYYSPYRYKERAMERQHLVLRKMVETGQIAEAEEQAALKQPIRLAPPQGPANKAPYFTDFVKAELIRQLKGRISEHDLSEAGLKVYTTLDLTMNSAAQRAVSDGIGELEKRFKIPSNDPRRRLEGALASVDPVSGAVRALVGGRSYGQSTFNRILNMKRQVGSTFKPIVFLTALGKGFDPQGVPYGPGHPIDDSPWTLVYDRGKQSWTPRNYEKEALGWISFRTALSHSINTSTARLAWEVGIPEIIRTARALGIQSDLPEVPSLALGVAELSPIELLKVYATFANHGVQDELRVIRAINEDNGSEYKRPIYESRQAIDVGPVDLLTDMLQSVFTEGTGRAAVNMGFDRPAAGKTGTTSDHRDAWFAGYTPQLATVVWVGADQYLAPDTAKTSGKSATKDKTLKVNLTGANSALPIWADYMKAALEGEPPLNFPESPNLVTVTIDRRSGQESDSGCGTTQILAEKYIKGFEPRQKTCLGSWPTSVHKTEAH